MIFRLISYAQEGLGVVTWTEYTAKPISRDKRVIDVFYILTTSNH